MSYLELLKKLYYEERKKLEAMGIHEQESRLRLIQKRKDLLEKAQDHLSIPELLGRVDIFEDTKDRLLRDGDNEHRVQEGIAKNIDNELSALEDEEKGLSRKVMYPAREFADYLFQQQKIFALENELSEERLFPDAVFDEQKFIAEKSVQAAEKS